MYYHHRIIAALIVGTSFFLADAGRLPLKDITTSFKGNTPLRKRKADSPATPFSQQLKKPRCAVQENTSLSPIVTTLKANTDESQVLFSPQGDPMKIIMQKLEKTYKDNANPRKSKIFLNAWLLTHSAFVDRLIEASDAGVKVSLIVGKQSCKHNKGVLARLAVKDDIKLYLLNKTYANHLKTIAYQYYDQDNESVRYGVEYGSANFTYFGSYHNKENVQIEESNCPLSFNTFVKFFNETKRACVSWEEFLNENYSPNTPERLDCKELMYTPSPFKSSYHCSTHYDLWGGVIDRIAPARKGDKVIISSCTYNHPELTDKLCGLLKHGVKASLFLDRRCIKGKKSLAQLQKLEEAGAEINCYKPPGNGRQLHHEKFALIHRFDKTILCTLTKNAVKKANDRDIDIMVMRLYEDEAEVIQEYLSHIEQLRVSYHYSNFNAADDARECDDDVVDPRVLLFD